MNEALVLRKPARSSFDYSGLDTRASHALRSHASVLVKLTKDTGINLWKMGRRLADAQEHLAAHGNGTFVRWLETEAGLNYRTAYRLIRIYRTLDFDTVSETPLATSVLYALSEPSTPAEARAEVLKRARNGETVTRAGVQAIVQDYRPPPPRPPLPPLPPKPQTPEYKDFERQELMPQLHDAGDPDAPQVLSGQQEELRAVPEERKEQARTSLKNAIFDVIKTVNVEDDEAIGECADEVYAMFGQNDSISIAARVGAELERGPKTLSDLVALAAWVCNTRLDKAPRNEYLRWRKRVLRLIDAITCGGGLLIYQHRLENGQIAYGLIEDPPNCP